VLIVVTIAAQYVILFRQLIIPTPNLIAPRRSAAEARATVERAGLSYRVTDERFSDDTDAEMVIEQAPKPGV
jgi:beta-lactam-binding protein with PASTA domain